MKTIKISFLFILLCTVSFCQNWQWARHIGSNYNFYNEHPRSLISDGINHYLVGTFGGQLCLPTDTLQSSGINDIFISKFDANGNNIWSKRIGGNYSQPDKYENAKAVFDPLNSCIYISGCIIGTVLFDTIVINAQLNNTDIFLAKMDLNGNFLWAKFYNGPGTERVSGIYVNDVGKIYLITQTSDSLSLGTFKIGPGGAIIQFDSLGNCISADIKFSAPFFFNTNAVFMHFIGNDLLYYGSFSSIPFQIDTCTLISNGDYDGFIAKADSTGKIIWINQFGNSGIDYVQQLGTDYQKNIYITGGFEDSVSINGITLYNSGPDVLIAKFDFSGNLIWSNQINASGNTNYSNELVSYGNGNFYHTGAFSGTAQFGAYNVSASNPFDMFLAGYDSNGDCIGVRHFPNASGSNITVDSTGNIYCTGTFQNMININGNIFNALFGNDIYLAKIDAFTGIEEAERMNYELTIYANPSNGQCTIVIPDEFKNYKSLTLQIFDSMGRIIQQMDVDTNSDKIKMNLEASAKGIYQVILSNDKMSYHGKIVFE